MTHRNRSVYVTRLTPAEAEASFRRAIRRYQADLPSQVKSIAIKVNLCDYRLAETGATTDPLIVEKLIHVLRGHYRDAVISVVENDATSVEVHTLFSLLGFKEMAERTGIELVNVAQGRWIEKPVPHGRIFQSLEVPEVIDNADLFINFSKLKTNALTKTTGALKNIFAFLRTKRKSVYHSKIDEVLVDLNRVIRNGLCLVDGFIGMEGWGPAFGNPKRCELLIAGIDPVATDACCARIMGFQPFFVRHIRLCAKAGAGTMRFRMDTDIPAFKYADYKFRYHKVEHLGRAIVRHATGFSA